MDETKTPPQANINIEGLDFNFTNGNLGRVHRLVKRHKLKERVKLLEFIIKTHQPLVKAMQVTAKAYQDGIMEGIRQVAAAEREREQQVKATEEAPAIDPTLTGGINN